MANERPWREASREGHERDEEQAIRQGGELWNIVGAEARAEDERKCEGLDGYQGGR